MSRSEEHILSQLGQRLTAVRLDRNQTQAALARAASVSKRTIERIEAGQSIQLSNLIRVLSAFGLLGQFEALLRTPLESQSPAEEQPDKRRKRASSIRVEAE
ncbi:MAG: putative transcriptional regulator [Planctomycetota bacterium]|jgi:putative transcriptional regulator